MKEELRDEELSRLYRETPAAEPPQSLDAAILAAARRAVQAAPRRRPGWRAWAVPMSVAATVLVTATLTLMVQQEQERAATEAAPALAPRPPAAAAPEEKQAVAPAVPALRQERSAEPPASPPAAPAPQSVELPQAAPAADAVEMRAKSVAPVRKEAAAAAAPRAPGPWLDEVRRLKQEGKEKEAAEALAAFRLAYPDYRLPDDLP